MAYYVWVPGNGEPRKQFIPRYDARDEAIRLCKKEKKKALVLEVLDIIEHEAFEAPVKKQVFHLAKEDGKGGLISVGKLDSTVLGI